MQMNIHSRIVCNEYYIWYVLVGRNIQFPMKYLFIRCGESYKISFFSVDISSPETSGELPVIHDPANVLKNIFHISVLFIQRHQQNNFNERGICEAQLNGISNVI